MKTTEPVDSAQRSRAPSNDSAQRSGAPFMDGALLRYYVAATRGDVSALCAALEGARGDAALQREILALEEALVADTGDAPSQETPRRGVPRRRGPGARAVQVGLAAAEPGIDYGSGSGALVAAPLRRPRKKKP